MKRALVILMVLVPSIASAHKPSDSHLRLVVDGARVTGSFAVAVRDLDGALDLDADGNGDVTWREATAAAPRITTYFTERLEIAGGGAPCQVSWGTAQLVDFSDGAYWTAPLVATCDGTAALAVTYRVLFDIDTLHRGIISVQTARGKQTAVARDATPLVFELDATPGLVGFVTRGVWFAWTSLPYLLVLACLVLPLVFVRRSRWEAAESPREVVRDAAQMFGAFALANGITLMLSAGGVIDLPARWIDIAIALSGIGVAAINLARVVASRWDLSFELGLLHGLGTALAVRELDGEHALGSLLGFGLGTALGGAVVVAALVPALFVIRRTQAYQAILWGGSGLVGVLAMVWTYRVL